MEYSRKNFKEEMKHFYIPFIRDKWYVKMLHFFFEVLSGIFHGGKSGAPKPSSPEFKQPVQLTPIQEQQLKVLNEKVAKTGLLSNIRIVTTAATNQEAMINLKNITTSL